MIKEMITSTQNEQVKLVKKLHMRKEREVTGLHLIEGLRLFEEAVRCRVPLEQVFATPDFLIRQARLLSECSVDVQPVSRPAMEAMCDTRTPQGVAATVHTPQHKLPVCWERGLWLALERVQDPGNMGTMLRSADAMGVKGVLISEDCADPYAPKVMRSGMGSHYHVPVYMVSKLAGTLGDMIASGTTVVSGHLQGEEDLPELSERICLVIGHETEGVREEIASLTHKYRLKMPGRAESLNAAVACGILLYELTHNA